MICPSSNLNVFLLDLDTSVTCGTFRTCQASLYATAMQTCFRNRVCFQPSLRAGHTRQQLVIPRHHVSLQQQRLVCRAEKVSTRFTAYDQHNCASKAFTRWLTT
jgi:hypothetical protein